MSDIAPDPPDSSPANFDEWRNPPVVERSLDFELNLDPHQFEENIPLWLSETSENYDYPSQEVLKEWYFKIEGDRNSPRPKGLMFEIPRIEKLAGSSKKVQKAIEIHPKIMGRSPRIRLILGRPTKRVTRFSELSREAKKVVPDILEKLGLERVGGISLSYLNEISKSRYPEFEKNGEFMIGELLLLFHQDLGSPGAFVPPFRTEMNRKLRSDNAVHMRYRLEDQKPTSKKSGILMTIQYDSISSGKRKPRALSSAFEEMDTAHDLILEEFTQKFTPEALKHFS